MSTPDHFDAVVIGSGFGGSVMTYRLAEAGLRVCLLERGKRYPPGSFARSPREMRDNFWDPSEGRHGLFQIWKFSGIDGIVSAGLGGGSLIYANVFIRKDERWFYRRGLHGELYDWPVTRADLDPHYDRVRDVINLQQFPLGHEPYAQTRKTVAMKDAAAAAGLEWFTPDLAVTFGDPANSPIPGEPIRDTNGVTTNNLHKRTRYTCRLCGECDIGCNYGSKNTLDYNYLTLADRLGVELRDHCEVRTLAPLDGHRYKVSYVYHDPVSEGRRTDTSKLPLVELTTDRLVLAAGTFGTAFLMLKNRTNFPGLSNKLGQYFSGNGDYLGLLTDAKEEVDGQTVPRVLAPSHGSVITSTVRVPDLADEGGKGPGYYIQDGGYPGFVDWVLEASNVEGLLHRALRFVGHQVFGWLTHDKHTDIDRQIERLIGDARTSSALLPVLGMGLDTPGAQFSLSNKQFLELNWKANDSSEYFDRVKATMHELADRVGARFQEDPLDYLHKKVTVHPVGGCSMGNSAEEGVVSVNGEVFGYPRFIIADGSVMPGPVGPNPSFTIAALADRFADRLLDPSRTP